jgi:hypothetical protein
LVLDLPCMYRGICMSRERRTIFLASVSEDMVNTDSRLVWNSGPVNSKRRCKFSARERNFKSFYLKGTQPRKLFVISAEIPLVSGLPCYYCDDIKRKSYFHNSSSQTTKPLYPVVSLCVNLLVETEPPCGRILLN